MKMKILIIGMLICVLLVLATGCDGGLNLFGGGGALGCGGDKDSGSDSGTDLGIDTTTPAGCARVSCGVPVFSDITGITCCTDRSDIGDQNVSDCKREGLFAFRKWDVNCEDKQSGFGSLSAVCCPNSTTVNIEPFNDTDYLNHDLIDKPLEDAKAACLHYGGVDCNVCQNSNSPACKGCALEKIFETKDFLCAKAGKCINQKVKIASASTDDGRAIQVENEYNLGQGPQPVGNIYADENCDGQVCNNKYLATLLDTGSYTYKGSDNIDHSFTLPEEAKCPITILCYDSEEGNGLYFKGTVIGLDENNHSVTREDSCDSGILFDWYCKDSRYVDRVELHCDEEYGCSNGKCNRKCEDTDSGANFSAAGTVQLTEFIGQERQVTEYKDTCSADKKTLTEYYCVGEGKDMKVETSTHELAASEVCISDAAGDYVTFNCIDSDFDPVRSSQNIYAKGKVESGIPGDQYSGSEDSCTADGEVIEYYCDQLTDRPAKMTAPEPCPENMKCSEGRCTDVCTGTDADKNSRCLTSCNLLENGSIYYVEYKKPNYLPGNECDTFFLVNNTCSEPKITGGIDSTIIPKMQRCNYNCTTNITIGVSYCKATPD